MLHALLSRIWATLHRRRLDEEASQEIDAHLRMLAERFGARGMEAAEAAHAARRQSEV
jgi:hypothetical protein